MSGIPEKELKKIQDLADKQFQTEMQPSYKKKLIWESKARIVIKEKLAARRKLGLKNDWKIRFYEEKLDRNSAIAKKLKSLMK